MNRRVFFPAVLAGLLGAFRLPRWFDGWAWPNMPADDLLAFHPIVEPPGPKMYTSIVWGHITTGTIDATQVPLCKSFPREFPTFGIGDMWIDTEPDNPEGYTYI